MNTLHYGDNLTVLRGCIADESVDLVYLDPPFNSQATYNVLFRSTAGEKSRAQIEAFIYRADQAGTLAAPDARLAAEQLVALARGEIHLRSLLRLGDPANPTAAAENTVATFLRAFRPPG